MIISQTAQHALRAVLYVARHGEDRPVRVLDAATALEIPRNYLSKVFHSLARAQILASTRGKAGGFRLAMPASRISLWIIVREFDRLPERRVCLLGRRTCSDHAACAAHASWKNAAEGVSAFFRETTVATLLGSIGADARI